PDRADAGAGPDEQPAAARRGGARLRASPGAAARGARGSGGPRAGDGRAEEGGQAGEGEGTGAEEDVMQPYDCQAGGACCVDFFGASGYIGLPREAEAAARRMNARGEEAGGGKKGRVRGWQTNRSDSG